MNHEKITEHKRDYLAYLEVERNVSPHTLRAYDSDLRQLLEFIERTAKNKKNDDVDLRETIQRFIVSLFYKKISKKSLSRKITCMRSFAKFLRSVGIELKLDLQSPRMEKKLPEILTVDEIFFLLDKIKDTDVPSSFPCRDKAVLEMLYATGVRCSELSALKLFDIDFEEKTIRILGKGRRERIALFGEKAKKRLLQYINSERQQIVSQSEGTDSEDYGHVFLNCEGTQITTRSIQRICTRFSQLLTSKKTITPHKLRHSFATHLLDQGVDLRVVQELLGHRAISSTEIYTQVSTTQLSEMCDKLHPLNKKSR
ncbi:tyrosine-type recombinase/integrase [bacterium]|jgi:integrase/recombinase XerC|nr:tyrosine-type recombinase/integrase [bacterium]